MRKLTTTSILNDDELAILANGIHQLVGESVSLAVEAYGLDVEAILRFMPVAERCRIARGRKGLSLKDAARALRVPQYRLKDIEGNLSGLVDGKLRTSHCTKVLGLLRARRDDAAYLKTYIRGTNIGNFSSISRELNGL